MARILFNKKHLEIVALKGRNILAMGAAHRNYRNSLAQALQGRNICRRESTLALSGLGEISNELWMGFTHPFVISPFQGSSLMNKLAVKTSQWREFRFNKNPLEIVALKGRNMQAMGAAHRNYQNPLVQALQGRNKLN